MAVGAGGLCTRAAGPAPAELMDIPRRICQVTGLGVSLLTCSRTDSRGYLCERTDPHTEGHWVGQHTIDHGLTGNGYTCESFGW